MNEELIFNEIGFDTSNIDFNESGEVIHTPSPTFASVVNREVIDKYSYLASMDEIKENDYNLNIPRYVDTFEEEEPIDLVAVSERIASIDKEISKLDNELAVYLRELGL